MDVKPVVLKGQIVRLEPLQPAHAADLAAVATPELFDYHLPPAEFSPAGFHALIEEISTRPNRVHFAIILRETNRAIGVTAYLDIQPANRSLEIGFTWIGKAYHGTQVNPECKYLLLQHAFEGLDAVRVQLKTDSRNLHSQRAIEKLGAVREGVLRKHMIVWDGYIRDTVMYSILADEWPQVKASLASRLRTIA